MAKFSRIDVFNVMKNDGLVPLFITLILIFVKKLLTLVIWVVQEL